MADNKYTQIVSLMDQMEQNGELTSDQKLALHKTLSDKGYGPTVGQAPVPKELQRQAPTSWSERLGLTQGNDQPATVGGVAKAFLRQGVDAAEGVASGAASTIFHGGDLVRRATGQQRIINNEDVQQAMHAPDTVPGQLGKFGEQTAEFMVPGTKVSAALDKAPLVARMAGEGAFNAGMAGLQTGGDTGSMVGAGAMGALVPAVGAGVNRAIKVKPTLTPEEQAAVQYADANGIPINVGMRTGNKAAQHTIGWLQNQPFTAAAAQDAKQATVDAIERRGNSILQSRGMQNPVTPEMAGNSVDQQLRLGAERLGQTADQRYKALAQLEQLGAKDVTVGSKTVQMPDPTAGPGRMFGTVSAQQPVVKNIPAPTDLTAAKAAIKPEFDALMATLPQTQQQASHGLMAMKNLLSADDVVPASVADQYLSSLKSIMREKDMPANTKRLVGGVISQVSNAVDNAVATLGPNAQQLLADGRLFTKGKYQALQTLDQLGIDLSGKRPIEPVKVFQSLTRDKDTAVNLLRNVNKFAPSAMPDVGAAYIQGLLENATNMTGKPGPGSAMTAWNKLGEGTKRVLIPNQRARAGLDNIFRLAEMSGRVPNPSGTGSTQAIVGLASSTGGALTLLVTNPAAGAVAAGGVGTYIIGTKALSKMLLNPSAQSLILRGLKTPAMASSASASLASQLLRAGGDDVQPVQ